MKKTSVFAGIILLIGLILYAGGLMAQDAKENKPVAKREFYDNGKLKVERIYENNILVTKTEYSENGNKTVGYEFTNGALATIIQYNYSSAGGAPLAWDTIYTDAPVQIVIDTVSEGKAGRSRSSFGINIRKTVFSSSYNTKEGVVSRKYEAETPEDLWIRLAELFNKEKFAALQGGSNAIPSDGPSTTVAVHCNSGVVRVMNYTGPEFKEFFKLLNEEEGKARMSATDTLTPSQK